MSNIDPRTLPNSFILSPKGHGWAITEGGRQWWFGRGSSGFLLGGFRSQKACEAAVAHDIKTWENRRYLRRKWNEEVLEEDFKSWLKKIGDYPKGIGVWQLLSASGETPSFNDSSPPRPYFLSHEGEVLDGMYETEDFAIAAGISLVDDSPASQGDGNPAYKPS